MRLLAVVAILACLAAAARPDPRDDREDLGAVLGAWEGLAEHDGTTSTVIVEFVRARDAAWAVVSLPAIHAWRFPVGRADRSGNSITAGSATFEYDPARERLTTVLPADLVPKHPLRVVLTRRGPVTAVPRPPLDAPVQPPRWVRDLGSPIWADVTIAHGLVLAGSEDGRLHALTAAAGEPRWTIETRGAVRARPALAGDALFVHSDDGAVYRADARTGRVAWRQQIEPAVTRVPLSDSASRYENRASAVAPSGSRLFVGTHDGRIVALDSASGERRWEFKTGDAVIATPAAGGGRVICGSMDGKVYALDERSGRLLWTHDAGGAVTSAVALHGALVLAGSRSYDFEALDAATGKQIWTRYFWFSWVESPATVDRAVAYVGSSDAAKVFAIDAQTGRPAWATDVRGSAWSQPLVTATTVYESVTGVTNYIAPHEGRVIALDRRTGLARWQFPIEAPAVQDRELRAFGFAGSMAGAGGLVFAGGLDGRLYAFAQ